MDGWIDGWMNGWMDGWTYGWISHASLVLRGSAKGCRHLRQQYTLGWIMVMPFMLAFTRSPINQFNRFFKTLKLEV